jgi:hypothetical protein
VTPRYINQRVLNELLNQAFSPSHPTHSPLSYQQVVCLSHYSSVSQMQLTEDRRGLGRNQVIRQQEKTFSSINLSILSAINCSRSNETLTLCKMNDKKHSSSNWKSKSKSSKIFRELRRPHRVTKNPRYNISLNL